MAADARQNGDVDPAETREWIESLDSVLEFEGPDRLRFLLERVVERAHEAGTDLPFTANTAYLNTIPLAQQVKAPGDSKGPWDYYETLATIPAAEAFRPLADGGCPLVD